MMNNESPRQNPNRDGIGYVIASLITNSIALLGYGLSIVVWFQKQNIRIDKDHTYVQSYLGNAAASVTIFFLGIIALVFALSGYMLGMKARERTVASVPALQRTARLGELLGGGLTLCPVLVIIGMIVLPLFGIG
jgi:hypothetical protein